MAQGNDVVTAGVLLAGLAAFAAVVTAAPSSTGGGSTPIPPSQNPPPVPSPMGKKYSMTSITTWNTVSNTTINQIDFTAINRLTIFHWIVNSDGSLIIDGNGLNVANAVQIAKSHGCKVMLGIGGQGTPTTAVSYNNVVSNLAVQSTFLNQMMVLVQQYGFDGVHMDFEDYTVPTWNTTEYTNLIKAMRTRLGSLELDVTFALWEKDIDYVSIEPYCDFLLYMFQNANPATFPNDSKICYGWDLSHSIPAQTDLSNATSNGHGIFFWEASRITTALYAEIKAVI